MLKIISTSILSILFLSYFSSAQNLENIAQSKAFDINGTFGLNLNSYQAGGTSYRNRPWDYNFLGAANVSIYGVSFPFSAVYSQQQRSYAQPFNQYGVSPTYKWVTLHGGWRTMEFSPFVLSGYPFLGGGIELTPGKFRFGAIYGRFIKASDGLSGSTQMSQAAFRRDAYAVKLGYGSQTSYFDLQMLRGEDDKNSLRDTSISNYIKPAENLVFGLSSRLAVYSGIRLELDAASSVYTMDTRASEVGDSINNKLLKQFNSIYQVRTSTQLTTAIQAALAYSGKLFSLKFAWKRIDPEYKSMGIYYSESDVENYTVTAMVPLMKNSLRLGGSFGLQNDNLLNTKTNTSNRIIGSFLCSYNDANYGTDFTYSTYGITQSKGLNPVIDSIKIARVNQNIALSGRYTFAQENVSNSFIINCGYQTLNDLNASTSASSEYNTYNLTLNYNRINTTTNLSYGASINYTESDYSAYKAKFIGPSVMINYPISTINISGNLGYQMQSLNGASNGGVITAGLMGLYQVAQHHSFRLDMNMLRNNTSQDGVKSFTELRSNFGYIYNF